MGRLAKLETLERAPKYEHSLSTSFKHTLSSYIAIKDKYFGKGRPIHCCIIFGNYLYIMR